MVKKCLSVLLCLNNSDLLLLQMTVSEKTQYNEFCLDGVKQK